MAHLVLEDGSHFAGERLGAEGEVLGEVVFNTSMTGYQEMLTDPSYKGQILLLTYPLIGNYGTSPQHAQSKRIQTSGLAVRHACSYPSHNSNDGGLDQYMKDNGLTGISELDTRAIARKLRSSGVMMGIITPREDIAAALKVIKTSAKYGEQKLAEDAGDIAGEAKQGGKLRVVVYDYGVKHNILRLLRQRGCQVSVRPCSDLSKPLNGLDVDGVVISPGPGDPAQEEVAPEAIRQLVEARVPTFGICLGHQLLARALGASTYKLKFGHRGGNQPVMDLESGKVHVSAHNHGYAVREEGLPKQLEVTHRNLNDGTVEGMRHRELPIITVQYHPEASPGPNDAEHLFDRFVASMRGGNGR